MTITDWVACPPGPLQAKEKLVDSISGGVSVVPLTGCAPDQPPEAVQLCEFDAFHCNVTEAPVATLLLLD
jgi:hypothetical protein